MDVRDTKLAPTQKPQTAADAILAKYERRAEIRRLTDESPEEVARREKELRAARAKQAAEAEEKTRKSREDARARGFAKAAEEYRSGQEQERARFVYSRQIVRDAPAQDELEKLHADITERESDVAFMRQHKEDASEINRVLVEIANLQARAKAVALRQGVARSRGTAYVNLRAVFDDILPHPRISPSSEQVAFAREHFKRIFEKPISAASADNVFLGYEVAVIASTGKRVLRADANAAGTAAGEWSDAARKRACAFVNVVQAYIVLLAAEARIDGKMDETGIRMLQRKMETYAGDNSDIGIGIKVIEVFGSTSYQDFLEMLEEATKAALAKRILDPHLDPYNERFKLGGMPLFEFGIKVMRELGGTADERQAAAWRKRETEQMQRGTVAQAKKREKFAGKAAASAHMADQARSYFDDTGLEASFGASVAGDQGGIQDIYFDQRSHQPERVAPSNLVDDRGLDDLFGVGDVGDIFKLNPRRRQSWRQEARRGRR
jgi:hypothetical protein